MAEPDLPPVFGGPSYAKPAETVVTISSHQNVLDAQGLPEYTTYTIDTQTTLPTFGNGQCTVTRRFNDFVWLRQRLIEETAQYQARYTIPSLPSDTWTSMIWRSARFDPQFIADRIKGLETFLNCVTHNPFCMYSRSLQQFLEQADFPCK